MQFDFVYNRNVYSFISEYFSIDLFYYAKSKGKSVKYVNFIILYVFMTYDMIGEEYLLLVV